MLESAVARPFHSAFGQDAYPTVIDKGIALFHSLIANHPFADGNKRTAITAFEHFLLANDLVLGVPNSSMYDLAIATATYRQRGLSHADSLAAIADVTEYLITPISTLKEELAGLPALKGSFQATMKLRSWIRRHRFNRLIAPQ
jgi:death-on-curing protein